MPHSVASLQEILDRNGTTTVSCAYLASLKRWIEVKEGSLKIAREKQADAARIVYQIESELSDLRVIHRVLVRSYATGGRAPTPGGDQSKS